MIRLLRIIYNQQLRTRGCGQDKTKLGDEGHDGLRGGRREKMRAKRGVVGGRRGGRKKGQEEREKNLGGEVGEKKRTILRALRRKEGDKGLQGR